ncbi:hypothetical protein [Xylophilus ampelinus]|uniref:Uncharacterized protein n=1 Tax=Xylophilus ampelinus TaxID=54067 RepID=A0A318SGE1_9BURK|nr:hypothetical protein [Xylophilus ampelinus]MCS4510441.1 hypothetical protein [Xylophilus ampelinus]PYE77894.1 hypothetical protein DFQ15_11138 [Xylophilus ampelinus]
MPDLISKIAGQFDITRLNADHPLGQTQLTPSLPSSAIVPELPPLGSRRQVEAVTRPRVDVGIDRLAAKGGAALGSPTVPGTAPSTSISPADLPPVLKAMTQARPQLSLLVPEIFGSRTEATELLAETLSRLDVPRAQEEVPNLASAPVVLLTLALAAASGRNADDALQGLQVLQYLNLIEDIADAWRQRTANIGPDAAEPYRPPDMDTATATAWQTLTALASTPTGLPLCQLLLQRPIEASQLLDVSLMLKAAAVAATEAGIGLDPIALLRLPSTGRTLAGEALLCAAARLAGDLAAAAPHSWALGAVRNDLMSDGPGSDFAVINDRLMKMGRWVERATSDRETPLRHPMRAKSPFRALHHGVQQVDRGASIGHHKVLRDQAVLTAASNLRDHLVTTPPPAASSLTIVPTALLRSAVLEHCLADADARGLERAGFDTAALKNIVARMSERLTLPDETPATAAARLLALPEVQALASLRLDAATLSSWTGDARRAKDEGQPASTSGDMAPGPLDIAHAALQTARDEALGRDTRVADINRETVRSALQDIVQNIEGSGRLRLSAGGISGIGLRQITATISALASALFLRGRVDAQLQQGRQAVFEIAMAPFDAEIMLATQRQSKRNIGLGGFIGPDLGAGKIGINVDANLWISEHNQLAGITLRLPRVGRPMSTLRDEFSRLVDHLLDGSTGGSAMAAPLNTATTRATATTADVEAAGPGAHPLLRQLLQAFPDLTVNQIANGGDSRRRHSIGVDLAGAIGAGWFKATSSLGGYAEGQRDVTRHYADASGRMRLVRSVKGEIDSAGMAARAALGAGPAVANATGNYGNAHLHVMGLPIGLGAERIFGGGFDRNDRMYEDGRLHPLSFVEREFYDLDEFLENLKHEVPAWLTAGAPPERLQQLLDEIKTYAQPTHTFSTRWIVTPEMKARDDAYRSTIALLELLPHSGDTVAALREAVEAHWHDRQCMQPYSMRAYDRQLRQRTRGVDLVAHLAAVDSAEASHIDNRLDVKPRTQVARQAPVNPFPPMWSPPLRALLPSMASPYCTSGDNMAPPSNAMAAARVFPADGMDLQRCIEELQQQRSTRAAKVTRNANLPV